MPFQESAVGAPAFSAAEPANTGALDRVKASCGRCLFVPDFLDRFYACFMDSNETVRAMFRDTDMQRQKALLRHGLMSALKFAEGDTMARACVQRIRETHGRTGLRVPPSYYEIWLFSLMQAVSECDPEFSEALEDDWRRVLEPAIEHIRRGY